MDPIEKRYFDLTPDSKKLVQIELCLRVYQLWLDYLYEKSMFEYKKTVTDTTQIIDYRLPKSAIEAVTSGKDILNIAERYQEPITALQDDDLVFSDGMEMAYYSIYNLYQYHIACKLNDSWIVVKQALLALAQQDTVTLLERAVDNAALINSAVGGLSVTQLTNYLGVSEQVRVRRMDDEIFIAKYAADKLDAKALVQFADNKLKQGIFSESLLNILDEEPKYWDSVAVLFEEAVNELGYKIPSFDEAIWILTKYHITSISQGCISPTKQFKEMLNDIDRFDLHKGIKENKGDNIGISQMYSLFREQQHGIVGANLGIYMESLKWVKIYCLDQ
jgi:hypothetical protein